MTAAAGSGSNRRTWRGAFRRWRRTRPFWGGLLLLIAGVEILLIPLGNVLLRGQIKLVIYIGIGGVFGVLIGVLLILCGLLLWFAPMHKTFYAVLGIVLALLSFIVTNLGGFFVGMLLGVVGGSMAFAWTPLSAGAGSDAGGGPAPPAPTDPSTGPKDTVGGDAGMNLILGAPEASPDAADANEGRHDEGRTSEGHEGRRGEVAGGEARAGGLRGSSAGGAMLMLALAGVVAGTFLVAGRLTAAEAATTARSAGDGCVLLLLCAPAPSPGTSTPSSPPAGGAAPTQPPSGSTPSGGSGGLLPTGGAGGPGGLLPAPLPTPLPSPLGAGGTGKGSSGKGSSGKNKPSPSTTALPGLEAATATSVEKAGSVTLTGFGYQGVANVPTAGGGTVKLMKFTASSIKLSGGITLTATQHGQSLVTTNSSLDLTGGVVLYASKLSGDLLGVPVTLTPGNVVSTLLQLLKTVTPAVPVTMTNVTTDQPLVTTDALQANTLTVSAH